MVARADEQQMIARLWLASHTLDEIEDQTGVEKTTLVRFSNSGEMHQSLGWKADPDFTDIGRYTARTPALCLDCGRAPALTHPPRPRYTT